MRCGLLLPGLGVLVALAACGPAQAPWEKALRSENLATLRHEAALVYKDNLATSSVGFATVLRPAWPASFTRLHPSRVNVYVDGVALSFSEVSTDRESGLYLIPEGMDHHLSSEGRARFRELSPGVYRYDFGPAKP